MLSTFNSLAPIFALIVLGFILRKSGIIKMQEWRSVELICFWLLFPSLLITTLSKADLSFGALAPFALALFATIVTMTFFVFLMRVPLLRIWNVQGAAFTTIFQTSTRWHGFIAFAIVDDLFGAKGLAILAIAFVVIVPYINVVNIFVLAAYASGQKVSFGKVLLTIIKNPLIIGISLGILLNIFDINLPIALDSTLDLLGRAALGMSLLALGAGISWVAIKSSGKEVVFSVIMRLFLTPILAAIFAFSFGVSGDIFVILMISASVPTAVNGFVLARAMGGDAELYAATSSAQVLVSFISLPIIIWLANMLAF